MKNRILIVDDHKLFLDGLLKMLMRYCDYAGEVKAIENGEKAINEVGSNFYDICFLDIKLPDNSGLDVMGNIRDISPGTKIVIMTASNVDDENKKKIEDAADLFIEKPVDLSIIKGFIDRNLNKRKENNSSYEGGMRENGSFL